VLENLKMYNDLKPNILNEIDSKLQCEIKRNEDEFNEYECDKR